MSSGDVSWVLVSSALVMLMVPGVGLFYSGLVRKKNAIAAITLTFVALAVVAIQWVIVGYSISFGPSLGGIIGNFDYVGLRNAVAVADLPGSAFIAFQLMFAAVTMAILTSAMAERIKLSSFVVFCAAWATLVYCPMAHWVWGGGWLASIGALDFAGGTVVHICSGFSALATALVIGKRKGFGVHSIEPHNIPLTLLGVALLWFGWMGFNGGSALAADGTAANAFLVTNLSAAAGALSWMAVSWAKGMPGSLSIVSGAIAGLVAITPAAGYVDPLSSIAIGAIAGIACFYALGFRMRHGLDESLDAWAIHGVGGVWGALATGVFATLAVSSYSGLLYGNITQFVAQIFAVAVSIAYSFGVTYGLAKLINRAIGLRVGDQEEYVGLDLAQLGEKAYS